MAGRQGGMLMEPRDSCQTTCQYRKWLWKLSIAMTPDRDTHSFWWLSLVWGPVGTTRETSLYGWAIISQKPQRSTPIDIVCVVKTLWDISMENRMCIRGLSRRHPSTLDGQIFTAIVYTWYARGPLRVDVCVRHLTWVHTFLINRNSGGGGLELERERWGYTWEKNMFHCMNPIESGLTHI